MDTGANVTLLKPSVVNKIPVLERPFLKRVDTSMPLADGSSLPYQGCRRFSIRIEDKQVEHDVWVAEIELDGIIGMDLLTQLSVDIRPGTLRGNLEWKRDCM